MKALRARWSGILVIAVLLGVRVGCRVRPAEAGRLCQEALQKPGQLGPQLGRQMRMGRSLLEQIRLSGCCAPHARLPCGGSQPARTRLVPCHSDYDSLAGLLNA